MHSPGSVHKETSSRSFPECPELLDVNCPGSASITPSVGRSPMSSPGTMRYQKSSVEFDDMVALFKKKVGYMPRFTSNENRYDSSIALYFLRYS